MANVLKMPAFHAVVYSPVARWDETEVSRTTAGEAEKEAIRRAVTSRIGPTQNNEGDAAVWEKMVADGWRIKTWRGKSDG